MVNITMFSYGLAHSLSFPTTVQLISTHSHAHALKPQEEKHVPSFFFKPFSKTWSVNFNQVINNGRVRTYTESSNTQTDSSLWIKVPHASSPVKHRWQSKAFDVCTILSVKRTDRLKHSSSMYHYFITVQWRQTWQYINTACPVTSTKMKAQEIPNSRRQPHAISVFVKGGWEIETLLIWYC